MEWEKDANVDRPALKFDGATALVIILIVFFLFSIISIIILFFSINALLESPCLLVAVPAGGSKGQNQEYFL